MHCLQGLSIKLSFLALQYLIFLSTNLCASFAWIEKRPVDFLISKFVTYLYFWSCVKMVHVLYWFLLIHNIGWLHLRDNLVFAWYTLFNTMDASWFLLGFMSQTVLCWNITIIKTEKYWSQITLYFLKNSIDPRQYTDLIQSPSNSLWHILKK